MADYLQVNIEENPTSRKLVKLSDDVHKRIVDRVSSDYHEPFYTDSTQCWSAMLQCL